MTSDLVFFWAIKDGKEKKIFGHLVRNADGSLWCFQDVDNAAGDPFRSGTIRLDEPDLLKEIVDKDATRRVFLYQKIFGAEDS
jgi:hypothetical protein